MTEEDDALARCGRDGVRYDGRVETTLRPRRWPWSARIVAAQTFAGTLEHENRETLLDVLHAYGFRWEVA